MNDLHKAIVALLKWDNYQHWISFFPVENLPEEVKTVVRCIGTYYRENGHDDIEVPSLHLYFSSKHSDQYTKNSVYKALFTKLEMVDYDDTMPPLVRNLANKAEAARIQDRCVQIINGTLDDTEGLTQIQESVTRHISTLYVDTELESRIHSLDLDVVTEDYEESYPWDIRDLNEFVGWYSNHLIIYGAVPDGGKTAALISQADCQAKYLHKIKSEGHILFFSNEQGVHPMIRRIKSCAVGQPFPVWSTNPTKADTELVNVYGSSDRIQLVDAAGMDTHAIDKVIEINSKGLKGVYIDQLHKVRSQERKGSSDVERLAKLCAWARDTAKAVCPVLTVHQIDATCRPGYFLGMDAFYGVKTLLQGEGDAIITINNPDAHREDLNLRYLKVVKNKVYGKHHVPSKAEGAMEFFARINKPLSKIQEIGGSR